MIHTQSFSMDIIKDINLQKLWNHIKARHFASTRQRKMDSDNIFADMRSMTDMPAAVRAQNQRRSLEYHRDKNQAYTVKYNYSKSRHSIRPYKPQSMQAQKSFDDLLHFDANRMSVVGMFSAPCLRQQDMDENRKRLL